MTPKTREVMKMSRQVAQELLGRMRERYVQRGRKGKGRLLDEFCEQWNYSRKHAIKLLGGRKAGDPGGGKRGRPCRYGEEVLEALKRIWLTGEQMCGKRLSTAMPLWLPYYRKHFGKLPKRIERDLCEMSPATIDRLSTPNRVAIPKRLCGTKPGSLLKTQIPIRTDSWDVTQPEYLEADIVAHCGQSLAGDSIWMVTYTDIYSGWTASRAVWNKGAAEIVEKTLRLEAELPFASLGFDCDNGSEFLIHHLIRYCSQRKRPVPFTRSRPYQDDNAHVEQKNWSRVRQLLGYDRLDSPELLEPIHRLYCELWNPFQNFFCPSVKLLAKPRIGSRYRRRRGRPQTPCDRLLQNKQVNSATKRQLREVQRKLDPFLLKESIEKVLRTILGDLFALVALAGSLRSETALASR
ncbi:MAG: integrase [Candidatus Methylacidiphilaceae bacterium]